MKGFTRVNNIKGRPLVRQMFARPRQPNQYVPKFHGYCYSCNKFGHRIADCRLMNKPTMNYESRNYFAALQEMNIICY